MNDGHLRQAIADYDWELSQEDYFSSIDEAEYAAAERRSLKRQQLEMWISEYGTAE